MNRQMNEITLPFYFCNTVGLEAVFKSKFIKTVQKNWLSNQKPARRSPWTNFLRISFSLSLVILLEFITRPQSKFRRQYFHLPPSQNLWTIIINSGD